MQPVETTRFNTVLEIPFKGEEDEPIFLSFSGLNITDSEASICIRNNEGELVSPAEGLYGN